MCRYGACGTDAVAFFFHPMDSSFDASNVPTPRELFRRWDAGELSREEFHAAMSVHARELIHEIEEDKRNPVLAYLEALKARAVAMKLSLQHGEKLLREVLLALSLVDDFLPARFLWNAGHAHVPLHCFFRISREPVFRIIRLNATHQSALVEVEHGSAQRAVAVREEFTMRRNRKSELLVEARRRVVLQ
jgi:hypothetical protein